jgi:hypothetical protein
LFDKDFGNGWKGAFENSGKTAKIDRRIFMGESGKSMRLKDLVSNAGVYEDAMVISKVYDIYSMSELKLRFFYDPRDVRMNGGFCLDYNIKDDETSWEDKACYFYETAWDTEGNWLKETVKWDADDTSRISSIKFRFRTSLENTNERIYIDNVLFEGKSSDTTSPTESPTKEPSDAPSSPPLTESPTKEPSNAPSLVMPSGAPSTESPAKEPSNAPFSVMPAGLPSVQPTVSRWTALDDIIGAYTFPDDLFGLDEYAALEFLAENGHAPDDYSYSLSMI